MTQGVNLILIKEGKKFDITSLVESIKWSGRKGSSSRSIDVSIIDDDGFSHARSGINVLDGHQVIFSYNEKQLFRGIIVKSTQTNNKKMSFVAYDIGIYLANNKFTYSYTNKTASEIFKDCCARFNIKTGEISQTSYKIPDHTKSDTTIFDCMQEALSIDFNHTGTRHFISAKNETLNLLTRRENILQWVIESGQNLIAYNYSNSIENVKTRIQLVSSDDKPIDTKINEQLEQKIGIFQDVVKEDQAYKNGTAKALIDTMLQEKNTPNSVLSVTALGIPDVISGLGVFIIIKELGLSKTFYVDEDTHTFSGNYHSMNLKLTPINDLENDNKKSNYEIGDIVNFKGGNHYVSSNENNPTGVPCKAGSAKITLIANGAKHPYHLIHTDSQSRVYGWVNEGDFS